MGRYGILPSTTSHKREPLGPTLEVFSKLGLFDVDLNLHHLVEGATPVSAVAEALTAGQQHVRIVSGGWCDFYDAPPRVEATMESVARQVSMARELGVDRMRLFFGRLKREQYTPAALIVIAANLRRLSEAYPDMQFVFENHDGASLRPEICRDILVEVGRANVRMNFDPINFEHAGVDSMEALGILRPLIAHVHLKGMQGQEYREFGAGTVDLVPLLRSLIEQGYEGSFTVEYEGPLDRTVRLYLGVLRARAVVNELTGQRAGDRSPAGS